MSYIKRSLTISEGLNLANDLIKNTPTQEKLIAWKLLHKIFQKKHEELGTVGFNYWKAFLKRHKHLLRSKAASSYTINRSNFTDYLNFYMYKHIKKVLLECSIAKQLPVPVWMDENGRTVDDEMDAFGYKVTIDIHCPDMGIVLDECGCNISREGDGNDGGESFLAGKKDKAYKSTTSKHCHFTVIGVTQLDGNPLMCVVIVSGKNHDILVELGVDLAELSKHNIGNKTKASLDDNIDLLREHCRDGKLFPGLPSCDYKGIKVPGYLAFTESGGITAEILTNIFRRMDNLRLFHDDCKNGLIPFALLNRHGSRFDVQFLDYINDSTHKWNVCLGVPYGTALWQVADSSEQHGRFKMNLNKAKRELYNNRINSCMEDMHLTKTDIVPLVRKCWGPSFCNVNANRRAIARRGWGPYNRNLLLHPTIDASMTETMIKDERQMTIFSHKHCSNLLNVDYTCLGNGKVVLRHVCKEDQKLVAINLNGGITSQQVVSPIFTDHDCQVACERSQKMKEEGKTVCQRLASIKKRLTLTSMTIMGRHYHMDGHVLNHALNLKGEVIEKERLICRKKDVEYLIKLH